jgi:hypothetical protein
VRRGDAGQSQGEKGRKGDADKGASSNGENSSSSSLSKNQRERLEKIIGDIEKKIAVLEDEVAKLSAQMSLPEVVADYAKFQEISATVQEKQIGIQDLYNKWEAASSEL